MLYLFNQVKWLFNLAGQDIPHKFAFCFFNKGRPNLKQYRLRDFGITLLQFRLNKFVKLKARHVGLKLHSFSTSSPKYTAVPPVLFGVPTACVRCGPIEITPDLIVIVFVTPANPSKFVFDCTNILSSDPIPH